MYLNQILTDAIIRFYLNLCRIANQPTIDLVHTELSMWQLQCALKCVLCGKGLKKNWHLKQNLSKYCVFKRLYDNKTYYKEVSRPYIHMGGLGASSTQEDENNNGDCNKGHNPYHNPNNHANIGWLWHWKIHQINAQVLP